MEEVYPCKIISEIAETTSGGTPLRGHSEYYGGNIPWIKSGELNDGIITQYEESITEKALKNSSAKIYPKGTLVLALYGATAGKTGIVDFNTASNQAVAAIYPNDEIARDYMFWFFRQKRFDYIQMSFGAAQPNISQTVVKATKIAVPSKEIQREVVEFLNAIESDRDFAWRKGLEPIWNKLKSFYDLYQTRQKLLKELDQQKTYLQLLRQTILQEAVQGKLTKQSRLLSGPKDEPAAELLKRIKAEKQELIKAGKLKKSLPAEAQRRREKELPPITEDEIPFELPEGWVWCRLGDLVLKSEAGKSLVCDKRSADVNEWGIIKVSAMSWGEFDEKENKVLPKGIKPSVAYKIMEGDYLISRANTEELIGKSVIVGILQSNLLLSDKSIRIKFSNFVNTHYINFYNNSSIAREHYKSVASGTSDSMKNITREQMYMLPFPLPPLAEQQQIVAKVQQLHQQLSQLEAQVQQSRQYAQQLLQSVLREAVEGKVKEYEMNEDLTMAAEG